MCIAFLVCGFLFVRILLVAMPLWTRYLEMEFTAPFEIRDARGRLHAIHKYPVTISGNNYRKVAFLFNFMQMGMVAESTFLKIQDTY